MKNPTPLFLASALYLSIPSLAHAQLWQDSTASTIGASAGWSNKVELADLNGDGLVDIIFANGGNYNQPGTPEQNQVFLNQGPGESFVDGTDAVFGIKPDLTRVVKARDINADGHTDLIVGGSYQTQTRLYLGDGTGQYREVTESHLPAMLTSIGDLEVGDIDGDGDMDLILADWGPGDPFTSTGGKVLIWHNDGTGNFSDGTSVAMPLVNVQWSWDLEVLDTDNDYDLDILVSCKVCTGSHLFSNDGKGVFSVDTRLPQFTNNYEFEPIDINGDGVWDVITINDGEELSNQFDRREHLFLGDGAGGFTDGTEDLWPNDANVGKDDNAAVVLDVDSDGDPDFLIAALGDTPDRLLLNNGGRLTLDSAAFSEESTTAGTLGIAVADLNGDGKLDVVQSQGELASDNRVYLGTGIAKDTAPPIVQMVSAQGSSEGLLVRARIHDNKTPVMDFDFSEVYVEIRKGDASSKEPLTWYGGALWRYQGDPSGITALSVCATDAQMNTSCSEEVAIQNDGSCDRCDGGDSEAPPSDGGCSTTGGGRGTWAFLLSLLALVILRKRSR